MNYVGIDLHKKTISICVVDQGRNVLNRQRLYCSEPGTIRQFFAGLGPFRAVAEATASYQWLFKLLEPLADRMVLAHPKKLRIIAESTRKSDKVDAQILAEFLALDMIPEAHRPTPTATTRAPRFGPAAPLYSRSADLSAEQDPCHSKQLQRGSGGPVHSIRVELPVEGKGIFSGAFRAG